MKLHWSARYVGIPYVDRGRSRAGADCWGLACLAVAGETGIVLPSYDGAYQSADERAEIATVVAREAASPVWRKIDPSAAGPFDVVFFRQGRDDSHAGVVTEPGEMLHMVEDDAAKIERYDAGRWSTRLTGVYRFHLLEGRP